MSPVSCEIPAKVKQQVWLPWTKLFGLWSFCYSANIQSIDLGAGVYSAHVFYMKE